MHLVYIPLDPWWPDHCPCCGANGKFLLQKSRRKKKKKSSREWGSQREKQEKAEDKREGLLKRRK